MYYKRDSYSDERCSKDFETKYSQEFVVALYEKYKDYYGDKARIGFLNITDNKTAVTKKELVVVLEVNDNKIFKIEQYNRLGFFNKLDEKSYVKTISDFYELDYKKEIISQLVNFSSEYYKIAKKELDNYFNIVEYGNIKDKHGENYNYHIIENADNTIGANVLLDKIIISKDNQEIGYVKIKYTNLNIDEECNKIPYSILEKKQFSNEEKQFYLTRQKIEFNSNNIDLLFNLLKETTKEELEKYKQDPTNKVFDNIATVDYSRVNDDYQGRGLGKEMYITIAKHLNKKGIKFRSSSLRSESAKGLWLKLQRENPELVREEIINKEKFIVINNNEAPKLKSKRKNKI